ncbi:conserved hypothetical protein [Pyrenophora tritici-repentis Pt-1C-BFP]|uniref:Peptidase A1 domain-containing protein n=1 Tax=Pyrenophora tritici-repentis (strain Pt-1C-BFP) TaxID=426418 RepID=B2W7T0_PYRTR|nr:uncharacterized protein PTRG_05868 [Pyrenophora tritici-repentis Pt-1C-BFP]EDU48788.1 conserved hypothetical protein [Pyrenophora tritici-repentis Pt-1C-BFP]PWO20274.1 hypothetical protein PtrARCrB10_11217 [Pyrenophora tritici-repentis]
MYFWRRKDPIILPTPYVLSPSGKFEGNDGKWSTFVINIGDDGKNQSNGQNFRVLISTSLGTTLVPQQTEWCSDETCAESRGIMPFEGSQSRGFDDSKSSQWQTAGTFNIPLPPWYIDQLQLDSDGNSTKPAAVWGVDSVGLGETSPQSLVLSDQYVVKYTVGNFYLGSLGLAVGRTGASGATRPNFIENMYGSAHRIASRSFGYTAGAYYRNNNNGVPGNLVLGGYDRSRLTDQSVSIAMPSAQNTSLAVGVNSILYKPDQNVEANTISFTQRGFPATIDSTFPYLILPDEIIDSFVSNFSLGYDETSKLFTVNTSSHANNLRANAEVIMKISASADTDSNDFVSIVLPYAAFDLQADFPLFSNQTSYFPIRRSENEQFVLGRAFLQEAYIIVDYEHQNFTVAPAVFEQPMPKPSLVTIFDRSYTLPTAQDNNDGGELSSGAIAGIVVGIVAVFIIAALGIFFLWKKRRASKKSMDHTPNPSEIDTTFAGNEIKYRRVSELTGSDAPYSPKSSIPGYYEPNHKSVHPINELSPDSTPAELYSPPPHSGDTMDYFATAKRGDPSGNETPRTPIAELSGEDAIRSIPDKKGDAPNATQRPPHSRSPSDSNIDEVLANNGASGAEGSADKTAAGVEPAAPVTTEEPEAQPEGVEQTNEPGMERRPSHTRGLSDVTIQSDSTAVSQPTPEELESWARSEDNRPIRPMSP